MMRHHLLFVLVIVNPFTIMTQEVLIGGYKPKTVSVFDADHDLPITDTDSVTWPLLLSPTDDLYQRINGRWTRILSNIYYISVRNDGQVSYLTTPYQNDAHICRLEPNKGCIAGNDLPDVIRCMRTGYNGAVCYDTNDTAYWIVSVETSSDLWISILV